jgi:hypothetical protein
VDYSKFIKRQVAKAFKKVGTLAVAVIFEKSNATGFNFNTQAAEVSPVITLNVKGIPLEETVNGSKPTATILKKLMFISEEVGNPDIYDKVTISGVIWKPVPPCISDGYTTTVTLIRET